MARRNAAAATAGAPLDATSGIVGRRSCHTLWRKPRFAALAHSNDRDRLSTSIGSPKVVEQAVKISSYAATANRWRARSVVTNSFHLSIAARFSGM